MVRAAAAPSDGRLRLQCSVFHVTVALFKPLIAHHFVLTNVHTHQCFLQRVHALSQHFAANAVRINRRVAAHTAQHAAQRQSPQPRSAAVLCLLCAHRGDDSSAALSSTPDVHNLSVVLTLRSSSVGSHRGEVSFPGGRRDDGEDAVAAAVRETFEECMLPPRHVDVIGASNDVPSLR